MKCSNQLHQHFPYFYCQAIALMVETLSPTYAQFLSSALAIEFAKSLLNIVAMKIQESPPNLLLQQLIKLLLFVNY